MAKRPVTMTDSGFSWDLTSAECPLLPHTEALGQKPKSCVAGMSTNMQGFIPLGYCDHFDQDSLVNEGGRIFLECKK